MGITYPMKGDRSGGIMLVIPTQRHTVCSHPCKHWLKGIWPEPATTQLQYTQRAKKNTIVWNMPQQKRNNLNIIIRVAKRTYES